jgi:hypothetical protein
MLEEVKGEAALDGNGQQVERISTNHLLRVHLGLAAERAHSGTSRRLSVVMKKLGGRNAYLASPCH